MKKNEMKNGKKKNVMMRVASALGILVLLTTCVISGTFAKYTTEVTDNTTARVAKWGFEKPANLFIGDLFAPTYDNVASGKNDNVIAPGTEKEVEFKFEYDKTTNGVGKPEVAYTFVISTTGSSIGENIEKNTNIKWYLDDAIAPTSGDKAEGTWGALLAAIEALDGDQESYAAGSLPEKFYGTDDAPITSHKVKWVWFFDETVDGANGATNKDTTDTSMGNADTLESVTLVITITATQIN